MQFIHQSAQTLIKCQAHLGTRGSAVKPMDYIPSLMGMYILVMGDRQTINKQINNTCEFFIKEIKQ